MAYDDEIRIKTAIDNSGLEKDAKKTQGLIGKLVSKLSSSKFSNIGASITGIGVAFKAVGAAASAVKAAVSDLNDAYKAQAAAELQLETAAKNNPYLDTRAVEGLKAYAGELQKIGVVGDESLMPMMANLAASGRTQAEIQKIMSAALDASASGAISLDSAVQGLNMTYSGQIGALGRQLPMLKNLTAEELKSGKAVEAVAKAYEGMSEKVTSATGGAEQLKNAWGDLKEGLGAIIAPPIAGVQKFFATVIQGAANSLSNWNKMRAAMEQYNSGGAESLSTVQADAVLEEAGKRLQALRGQYEAFYSEERKLIWGNAEEREAARRQIAAWEGKAENSAGLKEQDPAYMRYKQETAALEEQCDALKRVRAEKEAQEKADAKAALEQDELSRSQGAMDIYKKAVEAKEREIELRRKAGEEISREQAAQEMYSAKVSAFMELAKGFKDVNEIYIDGRNVLGEIAADGEKLKSTASAIEKISELAGGAEASANRLLQDAGKEETLSSAIQAAVDALKEQKKLFNDNSDAAEKFGDKIEELEELLPKVKIAELQGSIDDAKGEEELSKVEKLEKQKERLKEQYAAAEVEREQLTADERLKIEEGYEDAMAELNKRITAAEEEENRQRLKNVADMVSQINGYVSQTVTIMQDASNLMLQTVQNETDAELATLEAKYLKGEIGEEEYEEAKLDAKKKAAKEEYKIQMFQWSASILQATANIAQGVAASLSQGVPVGLITGTLCAAAGAVQIASIIASKPVPPSFAGGGIVPGTSYTGDNVRANVNSGEMILNATQQRSLWELANGRRASEGGGANITINNSASNIVSARPQVDKDKIVLTIDARVNDSLQNGRYDKSLTMANQGMGGEFYGI